MEEIITIHILLQKTEKEKLIISFYKASITVIPKSDADFTKRGATDHILMHMNTKTLNNL